ncbi:MAG: hypothetical protein RL463_822 [Bacteroidota bacterium]|jgi:hypothetical protein
MKSLKTLLLLILSVTIYAQSPLGFSFQTIIRDAEGKVQKNQAVKLRFSILQGSESGSSIYSETHSKTTNEYGVINLTVGTGTPVSGSFSSIVWGSNIHFLKTEIDPLGGNNYTLSSTSQLMSVPYATYASQADTALNVPDNDPNNELQQLSVSLTGDTLFLQNGGFVIIPGISAANVPPPSYPDGTVHCSGTPTAIVDVTNATTGKTWMDRNLGASQVATNSTDTNSYGDLNQWGRGAEGHQCRNSPTTTTLSSSDQPGHGNFITVNSGNFDWRSPQNTNLWQGVNGINNPCPSGYRIPTEAELNVERSSWVNNNGAGAFASPLKLPLTGYRSDSNGLLREVGTFGYYWSSTVSSTNARSLSFSSSSASMNTNGRANGFSVRCIKD